MERILLLTLIITSSFIQNTFCQLEPIDVAELTLKVGAMKTKEIYYGFTEGDQIVFNFELLKGKDLKEIEIIELPSNSKFMDYKTSSIKDKKIKVHKKSIYKFLFKNSAMSNRICKIKIQRIPVSENSISFNTDWTWKTLYDTTYVPFTVDSIVGYDTTYVPYTKKELVKVDTSFTQLFDKNERVYSETNIGTEPYSYINVRLPSNIYEPNEFYPYYTEENVSWSYFIGVGQEGKKAFDEANKNMSKVLSGAASLIPGYGTLASLAITGITNLSIPSVGDNVYYTFYNDQNLIIEKGNGIAATGRHTNYLNGGFTIKLFNDNFRNGIDVSVKVIVMRVNKTYEDKNYKKQKIKPRKVTLNKKRMVVNTTKIRINAE